MDGAPEQTPSPEGSKLLSDEIRRVLLAFRPRFESPDPLGNWTGHLPFARVLVEGLKPRRIVELGTHHGESFFGFCQAVAEAGLRESCRVYAVDHWVGEHHAGFYGSEVYSGVKRYRDRHYPDCAELLRKSFQEALSDFEPESIDLLHLDGQHSVEAFERDLEQWLPMLRPGGVLLAHDTEARRPGFGVWKVWDTLQERFPIWEMQHSWGLGVLRKPGAKSGCDWLDRAVDHPDSGRRLAGFFEAVGVQFAERFSEQIDARMKAGVSSDHCEFFVLGVDGEQINPLDADGAAAYPCGEVTRIRLKLAIRQAPRQQLILRFDPMNRPGVCRVAEVRVFAEGAQERLWHWRSGLDGLERVEALLRLPSAGGEDTWLASTCDPHFFFRIDRALPKELEVEVELESAPDLEAVLGQRLADAAEIERLKAARQFEAGRRTQAQALALYRGDLVIERQHYIEETRSRAGEPERTRKGQEQPDFWKRLFSKPPKAAKAEVEPNTEHAPPPPFLRDGAARYAVWRSAHGVLSKKQRSTMLKDCEAWEGPPLVSVLMPVFRPDIGFLWQALESLRQQLYPHWELCLVDDGSGSPELLEFLQREAQGDMRMKVQVEPSNQGIALTTQAALELASGAVIALMDQDDLIEPDALYQVARAFHRHRDLVLFYSDEDKLQGEDQYIEPNFKPDWDPVLLLSQNYCNHLTALRRQAVLEVGGFRVGMEGSQDHDLLLRLSDDLRDDQVYHCPLVLYHWRNHPGSTAQHMEEKPYARQAAHRALIEALQRRQEAGSFEALPQGPLRFQPELPEAVSPRVSVIVLTRDRLGHVEACLKSLLALTDYPEDRWEVMVGDNETASLEARAYLQRVATHPCVRVLPLSGAFNFSALNNRAVGSCDSDVMVFLNNDTEILDPSWLRQMVSLAVRPEAGAVGARLLYVDGCLQHAGVVLGIGGVAGHPFAGAPNMQEAGHWYDQLVRRVSAVTGAAMAVRREQFLEVGGFDEEHLGVAFNDVDLCLKLRERGYENFYAGTVTLRHFESASRGYEDTPEKGARFNREVDWMLQRWEKWLQRDPYFSPNLSLDHANYHPGVPRYDRVTGDWVDPID